LSREERVATAFIFDASSEGDKEAPDQEEHDGGDHETDAGPVAKRGLVPTNAIAAVVSRFISQPLKHNEAVEAGQYATRAMLLEHVWNLHFDLRRAVTPQV
jgi:hypothetical protein